MSLLDDILNNKVSSNNSTEKKSSPRKKLLNDIVNNRVDTTPQAPDMDYSQSMAARLGARNRANLTLGKSNNKMYDFSVSRLETEAFRKYQDSRTANQDYLKAYSDYIKNPNRETKQALDTAKKNRREKSDAYKLSRSDAMNALAEKNYEESNPLYKAGVKLVEPIIGPIVDLTSTITKKKVKDSEGKDKYVDTTGFDAIHKAVTKDDGSLLSKGYNIYNSVVSTATKMAVSGYTGGAPMYYGDMFTDEYKNAINEGNDKANSAAYAAYTTTMGVVLDKLVGNAGKLIGFQNVGDSSATEQVLQAGWSKLINNPKMSSILAGASSEGLSEGLEEFVDNIGGFFMLNQDEPRTVESFGNMLKDTMPNAIYSAIVGSIVGGGTDVLTNLDSKTKAALTSNETKQAIDSAIEGFENYKPDTVESAEAKERLITNLENTRDTVASLRLTKEEMEKTATEALEKRKQEQKQTAPNTTEQVQDANIQENAPTKKQDATVQETKTNYNIPEAKNADRIVAKLTENSTPEVKKQTEQLFVEPSKNKQTVKLGDGRTVTTPSETTREGGLESASKYINDSVSQKEFKDIQREDKSRRKSLDNLYNKAMNMGDTERASYIKEMRDNNLYTVEHSGYEVFKQTMKLLEDPETYYKQYSDKINSTDTLSTKDIKNLEYMQTSLYKYYADYNSPSYNPTMANSIIQDWAEEGTNIAQALAARRQMYNDDPNHVAIRTQQTLNSLFREEAKNHEGDVDWLNKNDPMKNSDSPYHMTDTQLSTVNYYANELNKIKDKSSIEYLTTYSQLNNYIQSLFGDKKLTDKAKRLTITNVLASSRIWVQNIKGNFVNLAQFNGVDKLVASSVDRIISNQTQMRSVGMSFEGDIIQGLKGYKQGISDSWYEFKNDVTLSKFKSKYTDSESTNIADLGKKGFGKTFNDESKVGHALNRYQDFVNFALEMGDRPFAEMYYQQSIYNQRMLNAQIDAQASGKNTVYNVNFDEDTKMYKVRYFDENGQKINTNMTEEQYNTFSKTAVEEELTEQMCNIAEKEALENTYQDDNKITRAALKMKDSLNDLFHVGDFGFGDMVLKFTRTGSNMAKALYEHSPLAVGQLFKDASALNRNIKAGTATIEMQHKVAREAGKLLGGAITMSLIGALDWAGIIDIEGEHDDKKGDKFKESTMGSQEFSVNLPGGNYSYKISNDSTIGSLSRLGKTAEEFLKDGNNLLETLSNMTAPFTNEIIDNSFMSSILDLGSSYSDPLDNLARKIASQPSNLLPGFMKDVSISLDNFTQRNTYDENLGQYMINQIINKTPLRGSDIDFDTPIGNIKGLSSKKTAWGEIRSVGGDTLASVWNTFLTGETLSRLKNDKISDEVVRVYTETNNTNAIPSLNSTKNFSYNNKKYDLSEQEQSKYMTTYGKTSYKAVRDLMNTSQYKNATDEQKVKLLDKAYDYAKEKANQQYIESKGQKYYNFNKKDKKYTEYKKPAFEEIIENDISIEEANYKRNHNNAYKLKTSITGLENYQNIAKDIKEIKDAYSTANGYDYKTRKYAIQSYINELSGLSSTQKAMLSKLENSKGDYSNYDDKILSYIRSLKLTDEEYQYMYKQLGLGGYWSMYYKKKKNK